MYEGDDITFFTNEHGEPVTLFFGKCWPDELVAGVVCAVVAVHAHPWKDIAPLTAGEVLREKLLVAKRGGIGTVL